MSSNAASSPHAPAKRNDERNASRQVLIDLRPHLTRPQGSQLHNHTPVIETDRAHLDQAAFQQFEAPQVRPPLELFGGNEATGLVHRRTSHGILASS